MYGKPEFTDRDAESLLALIQTPDFSVKLREDRDYTEYARTLLRKFKLSMKAENVQKLGRFVARCVLANKKNAKMLSEAADIILRRKHAIERTENVMGQRVRSMKNLVEENKFVRGDSIEELNPEAQAWAKRIKLIGTKSFKVAWFDAVKYRPDIIFTDDERVRSRIVSCYNKPVFSVDQQTFNFLKRNFSMFENGFYEYLEYLFYQYEDQKKRASTSPGYVADRTIFLVTTAKSINDIDPHSNLLAINTYGHERPTYKGLPEFLTPDDAQRDNQDNPRNTVQKIDGIAANRPAANQTGGMQAAAMRNR